ncbi:dihydroxyacetone kinase subunit L [Paracoccus bogoriensis]|uniref:dihydroxyacetone kinase subunit DhaL n=1 Tax=Paracoccus bogoriensis TaxID=242065 RepID=UPI001CA52BD6|nr:dihydroxyacetone kinase subunit DhaL [Paracoccus bogoriensis]MBW7057788.1 dihydroxyacetone kinase subunit L [Paracoccus bogoriensis]
MASIRDEGAAGILLDVAAEIVAHRAYLSEIDGLIGDGDHGVNMAKGFGRAAEQIKPEDRLSSAMRTLSGVLLAEIGGSMGPLYGMMFAAMADSLERAEGLDADGFGQMLRAGLEAIEEIGQAKVGDKTLLDAFAPALSAYDAALAQGKDFTTALNVLAQEAIAGRDRTVDMVARIGRAARLGERSRGVPDAGATSCALILTTLSRSVARRL